MSGHAGGAAFEARNPEGDEAIQLLPNIACIWSSNPMIRGMGMAGMPYMGCEVREPKPAVDVLGELVVARYRSEAKGLERHESQISPHAKLLAAAGDQPAQRIAPLLLRHHEGDIVRARDAVGNGRSGSVGHGRIIVDRHDRVGAAQRQ